MEPMVLTDYIAIVTAAVDTLDSLGVLPWIFATALVSIIGFLLLKVKRAVR